MKTEINNLVEAIFSQAVALDQSGGLRNTIYVIGREIFILNYDHTVLLRFKLREGEKTFEQPLSFKANDYDSNIFEEKDGKIIFYSDKGEYIRKKTCGTSDLTPEEVQELFKKYTTDLPERSPILLNSDVLSLIDEDLSHIEFSGEKGGTITMIQRNIYSGGITEISKKEEGLFREELEHSFGPVAIKTNDFRALFSIQQDDPTQSSTVLKFFFPTVRGKEDFILVKEGVKNGKRIFTGIVACCLYDEIIKLQEVEIQREPKVMRRRT